MPEETSQCTPEERYERKLAKERERYQRVKEQRLDQIKRYVANNPNKIQEINRKKREKITCVCGVIVSRGQKTTHEKTLSHLKFIGTAHAYEMKVKVMFTCECGKPITLKHKNDHLQSKQHKTFMKTKESEYR